MATPAAHYLKFDEQRNFGQLSGEFELSDLTQIQTASYARFLQLDADPKHRKPHGLEEILREIFPITSYDGQHKLTMVDQRIDGFYDVAADPTEARDLSVGHAAQAAEMQRKLSSLVTLAESRLAEAGFSAEVDASVIDHLRALGYIE